MPPKKEKKKKTVKAEVIKEPAPFKLAPVNIHFKIENIKHFRFFYKLSTEYSLDLQYDDKNLPSTNLQGGKFYLEPIADDYEFLDDEIEDVLNLNLHYVLTIERDDINEIHKLTESPLKFCLNMITDKIDDEEEEEHDDDADSESRTNVNVPERKTHEKNKKTTRKHSENENDENRPTKIDETQRKSKRKSNKIEKEEMQPDKYEEEEEVKEYKIPIAIGTLDLLPVITNEPLNEHHVIYLYPDTIYPNIKTPKISVHLYSVLGILQNIPLNFCDIASVKLKGFINIPKSMQKKRNKVFVDFSLITSNDMNNCEKIFTFAKGKLSTFDTIIDQPEEHSEEEDVVGVNPVAIGKELLPNVFKGIYVEDTNIFSNLEKDTPIYTFNERHRSLLTGEDKLNLEHLINYTTAQVMLEIRLNDEKYPRYIGTADLSPLLYPEVKSGQFCVVMLPQRNIQYEKVEEEPEVVVRAAHNIGRRPSFRTSKLSTTIIPTSNLSARKEEKDTKKAKKSPKKKEPTVEKVHDIIEETHLKMFAIFSINLFKPITEQSDNTRCTVQNIINLWSSCSESKPKELEQFPQTLLAKRAKDAFEDEIITIVRELPNLLYFTQKKSTYNIYCEHFKSSAAYLELKRTIIEKITTYVAAKFNVHTPTETNEEFKDLMVTVFNTLMPRVESIVNDYYAGIDNYIELSKRNSFISINIFTAKECQELEFHYIADSIWDCCSLEIEQDEVAFVDLIIKEFEKLNFAEDPSDYLIDNWANFNLMLTELYLQYVNNENETEIWLNDLLKITKVHPQHVELWVLLYVIFLKHDYRPGYKHAKMNYLKYFPPNKVPYFWERPELYYVVENTDNPALFSIYIFLKFGMYKFAVLILREFKNTIDEYRVHNITCALLYLQQKYDELQKYLDKLPQTTTKYKIMKRLFMGHIKYAKDDKLGAINDYEITYHLEGAEEYFHVAFLRCGFWYIKERDYINARTYFSTCCRRSNSFLSWYGMGICCYRLKRYGEAEICFSKATNLYSKMAELWVYLSMINLKKKSIKFAINCFEIARKHILNHQPEIWDEMVSLFIEKNVNMPTEI